VHAIHSLAQRSAEAVVSPQTQSLLQSSYSFASHLAEQELAIYGLTTGCGPLAEFRIAPEERLAFQRNLIRSHAATLGEPHPTVFVRAAMAVRTHVLARGSSGVDPQVVHTLIGMLNAGIHPIVRRVGGVGASGDLVELAQIALAVIGEGEIEQNGARLPALEALKGAGLTPIVPALREGLALINGTSFHTGCAAVLVSRCERIVAAAQMIAAMAFESLLGDGEALDAALHQARPHPGQAQVAGTLRHMTRGSRLLRNDGSPAHRQDAYTLRCIPQILGPAVATLANVREIVETEIDSISDNPLFLAAEGRVVHGGNFHGQPVATALDQLKAALVEVGVQSERRIARLLDASLNRGLPAFLVHGTAGLQSGFMGLQYCATVMAAENLILASPASVHSLPTNANNQDVVSMGMVAARLASQVLENIVRMLSIELLCAAQALELRGAAGAGEGTRAAFGLVREHVAPLTDDRPMTGDVERLRELIESDCFSALIATDQTEHS